MRSANERNPVYILRFTLSLPRYRSALFTIGGEYRSQLYACFQVQGRLYIRAEQSKGLTVENKDLSQFPLILCRTFNLSITFLSRCETDPAWSSGFGHRLHFQVCRGAELKAKTLVAMGVRDLDTNRELKIVSFIEMAGGGSF